MQKAPFLPLATSKISKVDKLAHSNTLHEAKNVCIPKLCDI